MTFETRDQVTSAGERARAALAVEKESANTERLRASLRQLTETEAVAADTSQQLLKQRDEVEKISEKVTILRHGVCCYPIRRPAPAIMILLVLLYPWCVLLFFFFWNR